MTVNKRKKNIKYRGRRWHGWGKGQAHHKGAGNRGGRGRAGSGKRGDANKPKYWKDKNYFGKYGFKKKGVKIDIKTVNMDYLDKNIDKLVNDKKAEFKEGVYIIDLSKIGYDKLLCKGVINKKFDIVVWKASKNAKEKIEAAGGKINILEQPKEETEQPE
jgi:large subunit ribosomal protein L15